MRSIRIDIIQRDEAFVIYEAAAPQGRVQLMLDRYGGGMIVLHDRTEPGAATDDVVSCVQDRLTQMWNDNTYPDTTNCER